MPKFSVVSTNEALRDAERAAVPEELAPYAEYLHQLAPGEAGKLVPSQGEDLRTVRLRLSAAARRMNKKVIIRRAGEELLFWENTQG